LRKITKDFAYKEADVDLEERKEILKVVKKILPGNIYYAISGQVTVWLISIFGKTSSIAQIGALNRFIIVFAVVTTIMHMLITPRFSRMNDEKKLITHKFVQVQGLLLLLAIVMVFATIMFSNPLLWILGNNYAGLNRELLFIMISGAISSVSGFTNGLLSSRGMIVPPVIFLPTVITIQVVTLFLVPLDTVIGVTVYAIITTSAIYLIRLVYFYCQMKKYEPYSKN
jgi:O-antigen/teichoic acid export membrane protein